MSWMPLILAETDVWSDHFFGLEPEKRFVVLMSHKSEGAF